MVLFSELKEGDLIRYRVKGKIVKVVSTENGLVCLSDGYESTSGYAERVGGELSCLTYIKNQVSGVSHAYVNGKALCGARHSQHSITVHSANCEKCREIIDQI